MKIETAIDPLTGVSFEKTRSNQIHITPANGKKYNNEMAKEQRHKIAHIQKPLHTNRKILLKMLGNKNEVICSKDFLLGAGFNFNYFTGTTNNGTFIVVYEFEIIRENTNLIIKRRK
jgi:hypothetical protein